MTICVIVAACGEKKVSLDPKAQSDKQLYEIGLNHLKEEHYEQAREAFRVVFDNFTSEYRILAKLGYADSYFQQSTEPNYLLAIQEYQDFISLFPFSQKACYAQLQIGNAYFKMVEKPDRDQTTTRKALDEYRKVVDNYPNCEHYKQAYENLVHCYALLAEHEFLIARFYQKTGKHGASVDRLKGILKAYPESVYQPKFYYHLAESLQELAQYNESCSYYNTLLEKWPSSEFTGDAQSAKTEVCSKTAQ